MSTESDDQPSATANLPTETGESETVTNQPAATKQPEDNSKVVFLLQPAGSAPMLKKRLWALPRTRTMGFIVEFLKKFMQLDPAENKQLFIYVNQAFAPALDTTLGAVFDCFSSEGKLVLHYSLTPAWG